MPRPVPAAVLAALLLVGAAGAQETGPYEPVRRDPLGTRLINVATPYPVGARTLEVIFTHRFNQPVNDGTVHDLWGLDSGADTGIGLAVGLTRSLDLSFYRSSFQENYEIAGKFLVLEQAPRVPVTIALRGGADLLRREGVEDADRPFAQLLLSRQVARGINLLLSPSWVGDTPRLKDAFNVPVGLTFSLPASYLIELEFIPENRDLEESEAAWHVAFSKALGGHIFEIILGNSRATTVDQILGGDSAAGFESGDVRLGFNIVRDFGF
ncbi:MAG TPA: DUF5777 family beta-barrel protein [Thermoanaerobaculia bacterium]|nr:DUF5777 family beta-barrel protein [Thermoanaerobaculia bacterium]